MDTMQKATEKRLKALEKELKKLYTSCYSKNKRDFEVKLNKLIKNKKLTVKEQNEILDILERLEGIMKQLATEIKNANVIWIQTNALGHTNFYKIIDVARVHGVPVRYFSYASAVKCAEQIILEDLG